MAGLRYRAAAQAARGRRAAPATPWLGLGLVLFGYAVLVAALVQGLVLPYLFPAFHAGHGLLVGGDWIAFHRLAVEMAAAIDTQGWGAWSLRPEGQAPAGIAAAIYAVTVPEPWTVIPVNAALHAGAALVLLRIVLRFVPDWRLALWAVLPFFLYPSAMAWYTQNHKDAYFIAGFYLLLNAWVVLAGADLWAGRRGRIVEAVACAVGGGALVWLVRPHGVQVFQGLALMATLALSAVYAWRAARGAWRWLQAAMAGALAWGLVLALTPFTAGGVVDQPLPGQPAVLATGGQPSGAERSPRAASPGLVLVSASGGTSAPGGAGAAARMGVQGPQCRVEERVADGVPLGYDADVGRLLDDARSDLTLYWQLPPDGEGLASEDFGPDRAGRWRQVLHEAVNPVRGGGIERGELPRTFPDDVYQVRPGARVLTGAGARDEVAAGLWNDPQVARSTLVSEPVRVAGGRLYLRAGWARAEGGSAWLEQEWLPSQAYDYAASEGRVPEWERFARVERALDGARAARVWLLNTEPGSSVDFDDVVFVEIGALDPSGCGEDAAGAGRGCSASLVAPDRQPPVADDPAAEASVGRRWRASGWLPAALEARLYTMAEIRRGFLEYYREAASNIDAEVPFWSAGDFLAYVPRALQIGLLAPFPTHWFERGHLEATTFQRRVTGVEMVGVYLALAALPYAAWRWRRRPELWVVLGLCLGLIVTLAFVTPNVGSLHRARYGPLMALVALGVAGAVALWERRTWVGGVARGALA